MNGVDYVCFSGDEGEPRDDARQRAASLHLDGHHSGSFTSTTPLMGVLSRKSTSVELRCKTKLWLFNRFYNEIPQISFQIFTTIRPPVLSVVHTVHTNHHFLTTIVI